MEAVFPPEEFYLMEKRSTFLKLIFMHDKNQSVLTTERRGRRGVTVFT
jgi:hypothetical protein